MSLKVHRVIAAGWRLQQLAGAVWVQLCHLHDIFTHFILTCYRADAESGLASHGGALHAHRAHDAAKDGTLRRAAHCGEPDLHIRGLLPCPGVDLALQPVQLLLWLLPVYALQGGQRPWHGVIRLLAQVQKRSTIAMSS